MKTVLIVEDEKMIRQGIKVMIQRSGVPVETILECNNGETALEMIREQTIDVMFTDIRMPKMNGIELVEKMQECEHIPLTVAISGYDDFSYAVDMMRNGVKEYILKPVERTKLVEVLQKLNAEVEKNRAKEAAKQTLGCQQIKHLMLIPGTSEELQALESQYAREFIWNLNGKDYVVCCTNRKENRIVQNEEFIFLPEVAQNDCFVVEKQEAEQLLAEELSDCYVGISAVYQGIRELRSAYLEAYEMRKRAFCRNKKVVYFGETEEHIPEKLIKEASRFIMDEAKMQRVQILGTERKDEMEKIWHQFFFEVKNGRITEQQYEECMQNFFEEEEKTYRNIFEDFDEKKMDVSGIFAEDTIDLYEEDLLAYLCCVQERILGQFDANKNKQKMQQAIAYIEENYAGDLNMAVVSNYLSMNYSMFSYSFKQYTGTNFVNYLKNIRMREAKRLLKETDMRIIEISQEVGYENEKHFMRIFKSCYGVSPSEYRKNVQ